MAYWLIALPLAASNVNLCANAHPSGRAATVLIRNYADIENERLTDAQLEAERILSQAGVGIMWRNVPVRSADTDDEQYEPAVHRKPVLTINLLSSSMEARVRRPAGVFGFAAGSTGYIFCKRLERVERIGVVFSGSKLLGAILAHEIGHLLLGPGAHAQSGVMKPLWQVRDLVQADQGTLTFASRQIERLRNGGLTTVSYGCGAPLTPASHP